MGPDLLEELRNYRQTLGNCKDDNLRTMGDNSGNWDGRWSNEMAVFMKGMAKGKDGVLARLDQMIGMLEGNYWDS